MKIIKPPKLECGDIIGIISPSEPVEFRNKLRRGVKVLEKMGFRVVLGKNVFKNHGGYMAGTEKERVNDLHCMFKDKKVKGIFCGRGGFNSSRLLNSIDFNIIKKNPKIFWGFSDITVLLNAIHAKTGLITFHGQNVEDGFSRGLGGKYKYTRDYFVKAVMNGAPIGEARSFTRPRILKNGRAAGRLVGGNLSCLTALLGNSCEPDWRAKILFWEEIDQTVEDIDFLLTHLRLAGVFEKISGMMIGRLTNRKALLLKGKKPRKVFSPHDAVLEICRDYKFPIVAEMSFGHEYPQFVVPVGVKAEINTFKENPFSVVEPAVR